MKGMFKMKPIFELFIMGFLFGLGFESASWIVDSIMQFFGFPLG